MSSLYAVTFCIIFVCLKFAAVMEGNPFKMTNELYISFWKNHFLRNLKARFISLID